MTCPAEVADTLWHIGMAARTLAGAVILAVVAAVYMAWEAK